MTGPSPEPEAPGMTVLLVDDDASNRMIGRALLEREGYRVSEARDGREALDLLASNPDFSMVVLDLDMPRVNGRQVLRVMRDTATTAAVPVIVLTGASDPATEVELLESGADDYLNKPLDPARFLLRVKAVLRRARG
jgi:DNA-binding response OmpR family regulator